MLVNSLGALAVRHAFLGHDETNEQDWAAVARAAADSVPPWIAKAVQHLALHPATPDQLDPIPPQSRLQ
jgi:hypothetical protein